MTRPIFKLNLRTCFYSVFLVSISGCFSTPDPELLLSNTNKTGPDQQHCFASITESNNTKHLEQPGFTLLSWNIYKGNNADWQEDLLLFSHSSDFILLQEAYLNPELKQFLASTAQNWELVSAFRYKGIHAGVMTMAPIAPLSSCSQRISEPLIRLPKSSLLSYYPIKNSRHNLLVANIHAINFTLGTIQFTRQLEEIKSLLKQHQGPIVFAGDFNTWSEQREDLLDEIISDKELALLKVRFSSNIAHLVWGHRLDHIFYRGLKVINAEIIPVTSSDHYPLKVQFEFVTHQEIAYPDSERRSHSE